MAASPKLKDNLNSLRDDASKVLADITNLTKHISDAGAEKTGEIKENLIESIEEQLIVLRERLELVNSDLRQQAGKADKHIRANPYSYIIAAMGVGALLGKLLFPRDRH